MALTPEGGQLFAHVQIMQEQMQAAESELASRRSLHSGRVAIGASETALHGLLLPVLRDFRRRYPGVRLQITNHSTPQAIGALRSGLVELAVVGTPCGELAAPLTEQRLRPFQDLLVAGPEYAHLAGRPLTYAQLAGLPLICLGQDSSTFAFYARLFARQGAVLEPDVQTATADQLVPLVRYGLGLAFVPEDFARDGPGQRRGGPPDPGDAPAPAVHQPGQGQKPPAQRRGHGSWSGCCGRPPRTDRYRHSRFQRAAWAASQRSSSGWLTQALPVPSSIRRRASAWGAASARPGASGPRVRVRAEVVSGQGGTASSDGQRKGGSSRTAQVVRRPSSVRTRAAGVPGCGAPQLGVLHPQLPGGQDRDKPLFGGGGEAAPVGSLLRLDGPVRRVEPGVQPRQGETLGPRQPL